MGVRTVKLKSKYDKMLCWVGLTTQFSNYNTVNHSSRCRIIQKKLSFQSRRSCSCQSHDTSCLQSWLADRAEIFKSRAQLNFYVFNKRHEKKHYALYYRVAKKGWNLTEYLFINKANFNPQNTNFKNFYLSLIKILFFRNKLLKKTN